MDSTDIRHAITMVAKSLASQLTQGQIDYYFQYRWKGFAKCPLDDLVKVLKDIERGVLLLGEQEWAKQLDLKDPLRVGELSLCYKVKMDWEF